MSLNFYPKHLISEKDLSASADMPLCILSVLVHKPFLIALLTFFINLQRKKEAKKESSNNSNLLNKLLKANLKVGCFSPTAEGLDRNTTVIMYTVETHHLGQKEMQGKLKL